MYTNLVVLLHGLGSDGADMRSIWESFVSKNPEYAAKTLVLTPDAPQMKIKYFGGQVMTAWFDVYGFDEAGPDDGSGLEKSRQFVENLISESLASHPSIKNLVIGGFSQGGALTYFTTLQSNRPELQAGIVMSGWVPYRETELLQKITDKARSLPIFHGHGLSDKLIPHPMRFNHIFDDARLNVEFGSYHCGHEIDREEMQVIHDFMKKHLVLEAGKCAAE